MKIDKLILAGGGTAGHVNAGIAILEECYKKSPNTKTLFIGTKRGQESQLIPRAGFDIKFINARGLKRESFFVLLYSVILIPISIIQSLCLLIKFNPQAVIGVGGFASGPVLLAAILLRKKIFILEQNSVMGFTNRLFLKYACKAFLNFPLAVKVGSKDSKLVISGNPVRSNIKSVEKTEKKLFNIFVFGGSQGARAINYCLVDTLPMLNKLKNINIIHQTGKHDFEKVKSAYQTFNHPNEIINYILDIENVYKKADLVISRAGASTISELIITGIPSILIPLPTAADNHQYYNAKYLTDQDASILLEQKDLTPSALFDLINRFIESKITLNKLSNNSSKKPAQIILETIEDIF